MTHSSWHVAVLLGGNSSERDVSIASGVQVARALRGAGHRVWLVDPARGWIDESREAIYFDQQVAPLPPPERGRSGAVGSLESWAAVPPGIGLDLWFNALHGGAGEDGRVQGVLESTGIPYTGSGVLGSALAMDKDLTKRLLRSVDIPTPDWLMAPVTVDQAEARLGWPVIVKPSRQGSTVGLSLVESATKWDEAVALASRFDDEVMIEAFVPGRELTVAVVGNQPLAVGEILLSQGNIFDYQAKYQPGGAVERFPAQLEPEQTIELQRLALDAHRILKLRGYSRTDFRLDPEGRPWVLEINTLPGLTAMSLLPQAAVASGMPFTELVERLCRLALATQ